MLKSLQEKYKVKKSNIEESYEYQLGLKSNEEYQKNVDNTFLTLANLFRKMYPNVKIESPRGREKSNKSLKNKIEKLEIERLCKLYAIGEITEEEQTSLYTLIINRIKDTRKSNADRIILGKIESLNDIDAIMEEEEIDEHIKTALLRIANTRVKKENKKEIQFEIDKKYGRTAAKETGKLKNNLLKWECIENINEEEIKRLHSPFEYLKVKDLIGFKFVIVDVPNDIQTDNKKLQELINRRKQSPKSEEKKYNELCCIELAKDFVNKLINDEELLEKLNIKVLKDGYKHKEKQNGYIAEHIKFCYRDHPEYIFEVQLRSIYCENISKANGEAAHDRRSGKKRVFPNLNNKNTFIENLKSVLPKYRTLKFENNEFKLHRCTLAENMLEYFLGYVKIDDKEYEKVIEYIQEEQQK